MPEILTDLQVDYEKRSLISFPDAGKMFDFAKQHVQKHRGQELSSFWHSVLIAHDRPTTPHLFLREFLWCVYVSGFSAKTISKKYDALLQAHRIEDASGSYTPAENVRWPKFDGYDDVFKIFKNKRKAEYIQCVRAMIYNDGWDRFFKNKVKDLSIEKLDSLPGIGPALACHLARNLGNVNVCKPDVHLVRVASKYGLDSVQELCASVSLEPVGKTDLILWLASVDNGTT